MAEPLNANMPRAEQGTRVFIDPTVLEPLDAAKPPLMSRTAWVNYVLLQGMTAIKKQHEQQ